MQTILFPIFIISFNTLNSQIDTHNIYLTLLVKKVVNEIIILGYIVIYW